MADDRIDIEINDAIDPTISKKLRDIATGADKGETSVQKLKAALADINTSAASRLKSATDNVTTSLNREISAQAKLSAALAKAEISAQRLSTEKAKTARASSLAATAYLKEEAALNSAVASENKARSSAEALNTAQQKSATIAAKAATEQQRLQTEVGKTAAAQARAVQAETNAERAAIALANAQARATGSAGDLAARAERLQSSLDPLYAAQARFNNELREAETLFNAGAIGANTFGEAVDRAAMRLNAASVAAPAFGNGLNGVNTAGKGLAHTNANILAQFNDLGVQFSMAAASSEPLKMAFMALIQQGSQLSYIAGTMENGWKGIAAQFGGLLLKLGPLIAAFGAAYIAFSQMTSAINDSAGIDKYVKSLGLTRQELKKLQDQHVTMTDVIKASWQTVTEDLIAASGFSTKEIAAGWARLSGEIFSTVKTIMFTVTSLYYAMYKTVGTILLNMGKMWYNAGIAAKNMFLIGIQGLVNQTITAINKIGDAINFVSEAAGFGKVIGSLSEWNAGVKGVGDGMLALNKIDPMGDFAKAVDYQTKLVDRIKDRASQNARDRLKKDADALKADRTPKAGPKGKEDHTAENRAQALNMVNLELDNELARMKMLKPEREFQQKMDQIDQELARKKITLNEAEHKSIEAKVRAIQNYAFVQAEADRILEEATEPQRTYNAAMVAAADLFDRGAIGANAYAGELYNATEKLKLATDPTYALNKAIDDQTKTLGLYGDALQDAIYLQQIDAEFKAKKLPLYDAETGKINAEAAALIARNQALRDNQFVQSQVAELVNPVLEDQKLLDSKAAVYAELDRLRQKDVLTDEQAERAKRAFAIKMNESRLSATSSFFGELANLTKNGHGAIGAISKAAAIAQATIDGYVAVQKALAWAAPPPFNMIAAAAVAVKTGIQVAGIISTNVGSYATGGSFMVDGKAGVDRNNINMNVSRGERVTIETPAQQRANDNGSSSAPSTNNIKIVNAFDKETTLEHMSGDEGETLIMNVVRKNGIAGPGQ